MADYMVAHKKRTNVDFINVIVGHRSNLKEIIIISCYLDNDSLKVTAGIFEKTQVLLSH